ncbi:MAG: AmmeMemoRadiSam system radical SAM enzyme [Planctomycetaceae bacterium]|nr:AmmeMemoRadiSam system radical SAM enzyme [Planctomycetaceae bacterium]
MSAAAAKTQARYYDRFPDGAVSCQLCPHTCFLKNGQIGICGARKNRNGVLLALTYGEVTGVAVDPIEKKPLYHFYPGRKVLSFGGWGCNLKCRFCQNSAISQHDSPTVPMTPADIATQALKNGSIGVAYTYNEPLIAIEYVMDCAKAVRKAGGKNVLVSNGFVNPKPLADLLPFLDAVNIDIKAFNNAFYRKLCGGKLQPVLDTVTFLAGKVHMELTTLIIPDENDAIPELEDLAAWIADNCGPNVPCHLTAYHPSYNYHRAATTEAHLRNARYIFRKKLNYVYVGNTKMPDVTDTVCVNCGKVVVKRDIYTVDTAGMNPDGTCAACGTYNFIQTAP